MITKDKYLWNEKEYQAVIDYKGNLYSAINVFLSNNVTMRELRLSEKSEMLPRSVEEFEKVLETAICVYSSIKKNYIINNCKPYEKTLFRGTKDGKIDMAFLSTSDNARTAFDFAKARKSSGLLLMIEDKEVPWIDIESYIPRGDGFSKAEPEILFLPSEIKSFEQTTLERCFDIATKQGNPIMEEEKEVILRRYGKLRCEKVKIEELDYSNEKTKLSKENILSMFDEYRKNLNIIKNAEQNSTEYNEAFEKVFQFKRDCCTWIHQRFYEINQDINNQINQENNNIQLSDNYDMKNVLIGNTGEMFLVTDKENGNEYYFKPAVSKNGDEKPYRAYVQESAYCVQKIINPENAVKCNVSTVGGKFGAIQEKIPIDEEKTKLFKQYFNKGKGELLPEMINQIMDEYLVDFCLCNYDSHCRNFIIDTNGRLRGIDKEQAFRYIDDDTSKDMMFSTNYNEKYGEKPSIYSIIFEKMKQGEISYKYLKELRYRASRLAQYPDDEYRKIFKDYAYDKAKSPEEAEKLLNDIVDRKSNIIENIESLYDEIYKEQEKNKDKQKVVPQPKEITKKEPNVTKTISMKSVVANAITKGTTAKHVVNSDKIEKNEVQVKKAEVMSTYDEL